MLEAAGDAGGLVVEQQLDLRLKQPGQGELWGDARRQQLHPELLDRPASPAGVSMRQGGLPHRAGQEFRGQGPAADPMAALRWKPSAWSTIAAPISSSFQARHGSSAVQATAMVK